MLPLAVARFTSIETREFLIDSFAPWLGLRTRHGLPVAFRHSQGVVVPDDWTGEVEKFPKKVTIEADKDEGMLAPNGHSSGERCPNEASCLDSSTKDDIRGAEARIFNEAHNGSH